MESLRERVPTAASIGRSVLVGVVQPEQQEMGARMVAELLVLDGWSVHVSANLLAQEFATHAQSLSPDLVVLSVLLEGSAPQARRTVGLLRERTPGTPVLVAGLSGQEISADAHAGDEREVRWLARDLAGTSANEYNLEALLTCVGNVELDARCARGWERQQLARAVGIDRAYLSGLENGRKNPTLGILLRVAAALKVPVARLMEERIPVGGTLSRN